MKKLTSSLLIIILFILFSCQDDQQLVPTTTGQLNDEVLICTSLTESTPDGETSTTVGLTLQLNFKWANGQTLKVKFLSGSDFERNIVREIAPIWSEFANIKFDFIETGQSDIRIDFNSNRINESRVGKDALNVSQDEATMRLSLGPLYPGSIGYNSNNIRGVILHEFGHALGLIHEHQHPENGIKWNREYIYKHFENLPPQYRWTREQVDFNYFSKLERDQTNFSIYDPKSIMHYQIPREFTLNGYSTPLNTDLSLKDKCFIGELYPKSSNTAFNNFGFGERGGEGWYVGDFNGDGKDDIMRYKNGNGGAEVALSTGSAFKSPVEWSGYGVRGGEGWYVGDFNGDGKDDIMRYKNRNGGAEVALSRGTSFGVIKEWSGYGVRGGEGWYVGDYNGDGKDDIMRYKNGNGGAEVALSRGTSFGVIKEWSGYGVRGGEGWYVGDYNGDGLSDIIRLSTSNIRGAQVILSLRNKFGRVVTWNNHSIQLNKGRGWYVGDYDGDGSDDILRFLNSNGGAIVSLSGGDCFPIFLN